MYICFKLVYWRKSLRMCEWACFPKCNEKFYVSTVHLSGWHILWCSWLKHTINVSVYHQTIRKSDRALQSVLGRNMPSIQYIWKKIYLRHFWSLTSQDLQQIMSSLALQFLCNDLLLLQVCFCLLWTSPFLHTPLAIWLSWEKKKKESFPTEGEWVFETFPWAELRGFTKLKLTWHLHLGCCFGAAQWWSV